MKDFGAPRGGRSPRSPEAVRTAGILGAVVGVAAAGVAAGVAAQRALVRRAKRTAGDRYADEPFGRQPYDETRVVTMADGTDIYLEIVEPVEATPDRAPHPTLVFVHGFCLDMGTFYFQRQALTGRPGSPSAGQLSGAFRMVFYDQPGHGLSGRLKRGDYELSTLGETLRTVLDETVPDGPLVLIGHSMGGMTIMALAEQYPELFGERVVGAALIATSGGLLGESAFGLPTLISRLGLPLLPLASNATRLTGSMIDRIRQASSDVAWLLTRRYGFGASRPSPALVSYVEQMNSRTSAETVTRYLRTLYTHARHPALAALRHVPTLVIVGDQDMITPITHSEEILRRLPEAEFVKVPDSGHVVMLEHADEVNAALIEFLKKLVA